MSPTTIRHWRKERGIPRLTDEEYTALVAVDAALRTPPPKKEGA